MSTKRRPLGLQQIIANTSANTIGNSGVGQTKNGHARNTTVDERAAGPMGRRGRDTE